MAEFSNERWQNVSTIKSKEFICWNCGNRVASHIGYTTSAYTGAKSLIYVCHHCNAPHIQDEREHCFPGVLPGKQIQKLPKQVSEIYDEARNCIAAGANTAAVMILRKILMNLAVEEGAKEGDSFAHYVDYLCDNGFVHRRQQAQAKKIQRLGNDANHKIESRTRADALELLNLVQLILINNYEQADPVEEPKVVM